MENTPIKSTTKFGVQQLNQPTPMWVTWGFRIEFLLNKAFMVWAAASHLPKEQLSNVLLYAALIDGFIWGIGKFFGISKDQMQ